MFLNQLTSEEIQDMIQEVIKLDKNDDKNYCLEQLEVWMEASLESEASPEEIYNCIRSTIVSKIAHHSIYLKNSKELLSLLVVKCH